jgi:hypothetical protein
MKHPIMDKKRIIHELFANNYKSYYYAFKHTSLSKRLAPNLVHLSVKNLFRELNHDSEETIDTNTIKISRAIIVNVG